MKFNNFLCGSLTTLAIVTGAAFLFRDCRGTEKSGSTQQTIEIVTDTLPKFIDSPIPVDSTVIRYKYVKVPINDTIRYYAEIPDSTTIQLPITQKVYADSTYQAWVSGYEPALDSIRIFQPITTITNTITTTEVRYKTKRWGLGVQVGAGLTPNKIEPYVGIGVTYNIFSW